MSYTRFFENAVQAGRRIAGLPQELINVVLNDVAALAVEQTPFLLAQNQQDLDRMHAADPKYDRLKLTAGRIKDIAADMRSVAQMDSVLGKVLSATQRPNGLQISKLSVPLGVVGVIYEARPNVTFDVFALCFKTGNVCVLKGGGDADFSNQAIISLIHQVLQKHGVDPFTATLLPAGREATTALLNATAYVDVLIPRGSQQLINLVREQSRVPVIETGAGIVHTYVDEYANLEQATAIIHNAKTRRVSVCNALDCLIIHAACLPHLPGLMQPLDQAGVEVFADDAAYASLAGHYNPQLLHKAAPEHFGTEFLAPKMAIKTVSNIDEALQHIASYSSKHSEAIISENAQHIERFLNKVDAAAVYVNASTAFTDGAQFGLGAEIGISTQKLHARGPMGLAELTTYKWIVKGNGHTRNP